MKKVLLVFIFVLALFLRVCKLGEYPTGLLWDEAALGYNAYSILKTGRDEYGKFFPLIFKSFGDYKPGFYIYLTVPAVAIFGLTEFSVRFPSAFLGSLTVLIFYFLLKENKINEKLAIIASFFLAISPWHLHFSRGAWELNVMTFEILMAVFFLTKYCNFRKVAFLCFSEIFWLLALFTYQSAKVLVPALIIGFVFFFRKELKVIALKPKICFLVILVVVFLFFNFLTATGGRSGRIKVMSVFSYPRSSEETHLIKDQDNNRGLDWSVFHSSPVFFLRGVLGRYLNHFSGKFLFFTGDWSNPRNGVAYHGVLYLSDFIFGLIGLSVLLGRKRNPLENLMLFWLVLAPLPSALTRDIISSVRSFTMVVPLIFVISVGLSSFLDYIKKNFGHLFLKFCFLLFAFYFLFLLHFLDLYFVHDPKINAPDHLWGYREVIEYIKPLLEEKKQIVFTTDYGQPYIFYLFYSRYNPVSYQKQAKLKESSIGDVGEVEQIDKIVFKNIYWPVDRGIKNSLFIGDEFDLPIIDIVNQEGILFLKEFNYPNNKTAFRVVETN